MFILAALSSMWGILHLGGIYLRFSSTTRERLQNNHNFAVATRGERGSGSGNDAGTLSAPIIDPDIEAMITATGWLRCYDPEACFVYYFHPETVSMTRLHPDQSIAKVRPRDTPGDTLATRVELALICALSLMHCPRTYHLICSLPNVLPSHRACSSSRVHCPGSAASAGSRRRCRLQKRRNPTKAAAAAAASSLPLRRKQCCRWTRWSPRSAGGIRKAMSAARSLRFGGQLTQTAACQTAGSLRAC